MISFFHNFTAYIPSHMYLAEAEATPELRDQLLAYYPFNNKEIFPEYLSQYLGYVQRLVRFFKVHFSKILKNI